MKSEIILVLDNIRSLYNVGAILRAADGCNVKKVVLCGLSGTPEMRDPKLAQIHQTLGKISKTALGAEKTVDWVYQKDIEKYLRSIQKNHQIVVLEQAKNSIKYTKANYQFPLALVVGNEVDGVGNNILKLANLIIEIPMLGKKNSLNVSVATGIILADLTFRQSGDIK